MANSAVLNFLALSGSEIFKNNGMKLVVGCKDLKPNEALRPDFSHYHDHLNQRRGIDMLYVASSCLNTAFQEDTPDVDISNPNRIDRFGAAEKHCSLANKIDVVLRRLWMALIVNVGEVSVERDEPYNAGLYFGQETDQFAQASQRSEPYLTR